MKYNLPFCIGPSLIPHNPGSLPDTFPLELCIDDKKGRLEQVFSEKLDVLLTEAYSLGVEMGTPSDDSNLGKPYVDDFLRFVSESTLQKGRALEIGAGVGYLSKVLKEAGWKLDSLEPGVGYAEHWKRHGVEVINDFFPSPKAQGPYDLIVFYTVLEHIKDTTAFLSSVIQHLKPSGKIILAVPDCTMEIEEGDPSMLLHEHYQYFTSGSLSRTLSLAGLDSIIVKSKFGRCLYASASIAECTSDLSVGDLEIAKFKEYLEKVNVLRSMFEKNIWKMLSMGSVGIYCPARALALLPFSAEVRFFDDSRSLLNKYYPPYSAKIEQRDDFVKNPTDYLIIMSRTFGAKLKSELGELVNKSKIVLVEEMCKEVV